MTTKFYDALDGITVHKIRILELSEGIPQVVLPKDRKILQALACLVAGMILSKEEGKEIVIQ